ncbi:OmpA family protein [Nocardiopsis algeriensis]|uniref:Outer membrane protein OmpA-like peptidoglycan-associated protein n=1 Tax=Nocardiopsis algeriensis TaxID=1478215 RepID=A0A841IWU3_9ACTN|nr:OmpA family protein [Nocardiopsis algeriensis]MBB6120651.1 outer membrane protein OmpA-like peptidoglycan-associated protein [Nocardiopsis algeriensis]
MAPLILFIPGCVVDGGTGTSADEGPGAVGDPTTGPQEEPSEHLLKPIASTITTTTSIGPELQVDIVALERLENEILRLNINIKNNSSNPFSLGGSLSEEGESNTASQISLIDAENQQRYISYNQSNGDCFCSPPLQGSIGGGQSAEMWVAYPEPPEEVDNMTVVLPLAPPIMDIPISTSSESMENSNLLEPQILDLTTITDNIDDQTGRTEDNDEVTIILSSDVLFETNSSDLNPDALSILEQVATEIDDASGETIKIDGHADNRGSNSVNIPLSEDRASSVEEELRTMITRPGISFETQGHGSSDPIADNSTNEGRERNRRVSITFEK